MERGSLEEGHPKRMRQARAEELECPVASVVCVTQLNILKKDLDNMRTKVATEGRLLKVEYGPGVRDFHC
jgi:hypothetical protein